MFYCSYANCFNIMENAHCMVPGGFRLLSHFSKHGGIDQYYRYYHLIVLALLCVHKFFHSAWLLKCPTKGPEVTATSAFMHDALKSYEEKTAIPPMNFEWWRVHSEKSCSLTAEASFWRRNTLEMSLGWTALLSVSKYC